MAKVWKDANEVIKSAIVPKKLWKYEDEMKKKTKFDKIKKGNPRKR